MSNKILHNEQELLRNYQACGKEYFTENIEKYTKDVEELTEKYKNLFFWKKAFVMGFFGQKITMSLKKYYKSMYKSVLRVYNSINVERREL